MKACGVVVATGFLLAWTSGTPDGITVLGVTMIGFGLAGIALLRSPE